MNRCIFILVIAFIWSNGTASSLPSILTFYPHFVDEQHLYQDPLAVLTTETGDIWLAYEDHVLRQQGARITKIQHAEISNTPISDRRPIIKLADFGQQLLVSFNQKLFAISKVDNDIQFIGGDNDKIIDMVIINNNSALILTLDGLFQLNFDHQTYTTIDLSSSIMPFVQDFLGCDLLVDSSGNIWLVSAFSQIVKLNWGQNTLKNVESYSYNSELIFYSIAEIKDGYFVIGTISGLVSFNLADGQFSQLKTNQIKGSVYSVHRAENQIILRTKSQVFLSSLALSQFTPIKLNLENKHERDSLVGITTSLVDSEGIVWVSVREKGLFKYSELKNQIKPLQVNNELLNGSFTLAQILDDNFVLSSNRKTLIVKKIHQNSNQYSQVAAKFEQPIYAIEHLSNHQFLAGGNRAILIFDQFKLSQKIDIPERFESRITSVAKAGDFLFAVSEITGLHLYDLKKQQFSMQPAFANISRKDISFITTTPSNQLIVVTNDRYTILDADGFNPIKSSSLPWPPLHSIKHQDWLLFYGKGNSLYRVNIVTGKKEQHYFPIDSVGCALEMQDKRWIVMEQNGPLHVLSPQKTMIQTLDKSYGMPAGGAYGNICLLVENTLVFSTYQGLMSLDIEPTKMRRFDSAVQIASISIGDLEYKQSQTERNTIEIENDDFPFTLSLYNSSNLNTDNSEFEYRLLPAIKSWTAVENEQGKLTFNGLNSGQYQVQLRVKPLHHAGVTYRVIKLTVNPSFWLSHWAFLAYVLTIILVFLTSLKIKNQIAKRKEAYLNRLVSEKTLALRHANDQLESVLVKKEREFGNLSHEIRTPLTLIIEPLEQLKRLKSYDSKIIEIIDRNSKRLLHIVEELLDLEKIRVQSYNKKYRCSITRTIKEVHDSFKALADNKNIVLAYQISNNCKAMLLPDSLHKILGNLLSNAVKYSDCGATVTIESHSNQQGDCEIKINNRPTVIAPKQLSLIFNRFYRINNQESERETGSGLGLSIVKELIEANNCHISVESNATIGTSFTVTIPCKIIANNQANSAEIEPNQQSTESTKFSSTDNKSHAKTNKQSVNLPTIFVVEDNPDLNSFLCDLLSNDYLCISAKNGKEAFEQIKKTLPDLILSDILMPELDGLSLCKRLKSESTTSQIPVILLTARDDDETRNKGWENLADALLTKPFKSKELLLRINNLIANRQIVKNLQSNEISQSRQLNEHEHASLAKLDRKFLTKLDRFIENNYQSCTLNVDKIASHMAMSERQLQRKLKALTGHSINDYLKQHRLICAAQYLKDGHRVTEVTDMVGFSSSAYFSKCFKEFYQMTPKNYQKSYKDA